MFESLAQLMGKTVCCCCERQLAHDIFLCSTCLEDVPKTLQRLEDLELVHPCWALMPYAGVGGALIRKAKHQHNLRLAHKIGVLLGHASQQLSPPQAIVPIPSTRHRLRFRGFNLAAVLAQYVAKQHNVPCLSNALIRRDIGQQARRTPAERRDKLGTRFELNIRALPEHVMLIDDVHTTGATLEAASIALLERCRHVSAVVVASRQL